MTPSILPDCFDVVRSAEKDARGSLTPVTLKPPSSNSSMDPAIDTPLVEMSARMIADFPRMIIWQLREVVRDFEST